MTGNNKYARPPIASHIVFFIQPSDHTEFQFTGLHPVIKLANRITKVYREENKENDRKNAVITLSCFTFAAIAENILPASDKIDEDAYLGTYGMSCVFRVTYVTNRKCSTI